MALMVPLGERSEFMRERIDDFLLFFWTQPLDLFNKIIFFENYHFYYFLWFITSFLFGIAYMFFIENKNVIKEINGFFYNKCCRLEMYKDFYYFFLRFLFKPLFFGFFAINLNEIKDFVESTLRDSGLLSLEPAIYLDAYYGPIWLSFVTFLLIDFSAFLSHFLRHKIKTFWRFHMIHHLATSLTPFTKTRQHPLDYLFNEIFSAVFVSLGYIILILKVKIYGTPDIYINPIVYNVIFFNIIIHLRHSHIRIGYGRLSYMFISPYMHQIHHSSDVKHGDKNFGVVLSVWDLIFGTFYKPQKNEVFQMGVKGYEDILEKPIVAELLLPFKLLKNDFLEVLWKK